jgi:CheY-like chemotaxis protein
MEESVLFVNSSEGCHLYIQLLRERQLHVIHVCRPEDALPVLTRHLANVVVTDLVFADTAVEGTAFIRAVRSQVDDATSIVVLSRYVRAGDREDARAAGADLFLMKPALPTALVFEVQRALILRRSGRRLPWNWPYRPVAAALPPAVDRRRGSSHS